MAWKRFERFLDIMTNRCRGKDEESARFDSAEAIELFID
jgi:hypothetical protein